MPDNFKRKLTAILSADAVGYSRLMAEDETATVKTIASYREIMASLIKQHRGRVVDSPGDNLLAEFSSVVDAVQCAVAVQNEFQTRNAELAENRRMKFRIGINLGDVIDEEDRIYGDGVNVAARLEALADPGGICVSKTAFDQIETKLPLGYEYLGEQSVKNIPKPVGAYRVLMKPDAVGKVIGEKRFLGRISRRTAMAAIIMLVMVAGGLISWNIYLHQSNRIMPASVEKMAFPLPDKPSIAVLPFVNMSDDSKLEYFSDGITEDLITDLSKISGLFVIARNSVFTYKEKPVKIRQVAEELGVRYVMEGSVRRSGNQVRINAQLIDATSGGHLWADRYDGKMEHVFALQDRITQKIISVLEVKLTAGEEKLVSHKGTNSTEAYEAFLQGQAFYWRDTRNDIAHAISYLEKAVKIDPNYSRAYAALSASYLRGGRMSWGSNPELSYLDYIEKARRYLKIAMKDPTPLAYLVASKIHRIEGRYQEAIVDATRAIVLDANDPVSYVAMANALVYAGRPDEAADAIKKAMRLNPHYPPTYLQTLGSAQFGLNQFKNAAVSYGEAIKRDPNLDDVYVQIAAAYGHLGHDKEAKAALKIFNERMVTAGMKDEFTLQRVDLWGFKEQKDINRWREGLRLAGMPPGHEPVANVNELIFQTEKGPEVKGATIIDVTTAKVLFDKGVPFIDVRGASSRDSGYIPGAVNLHTHRAFSKIELAKIVRKDHEVVIYCSGRT